MTFFISFSKIAITPINSAVRAPIIKIKSVVTSAKLYIGESLATIYSSCNHCCSMMIRADIGVGPPWSLEAKHAKEFGLT